MFSKVKTYFVERTNMTAISCYSFGTGLSVGFFIVIMPYIQLYYNMSYTLVGLYLLTRALSSFIAVIPINYISGKIMGSAYLLLTGSIIIALSLITTCYLGEMWLVFFSSGLSGIGLCWSDTSSTTQTMLFEKKTNKNRMGWMRFVNTIGCIVGGSVIGAVVQYNVDLFSFGIGFMIFFITGSIVPFSWLIEWNEETETVGTVKCIDDNPIYVISYKPLIPISIINFLLSVINSSITDWGVLYYSIVLQSSPFVITIGFTIYKLVVAFGRYPVDYLGKIYSTRSIILVSAFFSAIGLTIVVVSSFVQNDILKVILATFGLSISALGICTIKPTIMSEIKNNNINISPVKSNTFITYFSQAGMLISKPMMAGIAAGTNDLRYVFGLNAFLSFILFLFIFLIIQEQTPYTPPEILTKIDIKLDDANL